MQEKKWETRQFIEKTAKIGGGSFNHWVKSKCKIEPLSAELINGHLSFVYPIGTAQKVIEARTEKTRVFFESTKSKEENKE